MKVERGRSINSGNRFRGFRVIGLLTLSLALPGQDLRGFPRFPTPNRPVPSVISAEYSDEKTRDRHQEAERVIDRLAIRPGMRVADIGAGRGY